MKTTKSILEVTGLTYPKYDAWRFNHFIDWCYALSVDHSVSPQKLIKHDGILNWYCDMWLLHVEKQFFKDNQDLLQFNDCDQVQHILMTYPDALLTMHPVSLIRMIKTKKTPVKTNA